MSTRLSQVDVTDPRGYVREVKFNGTGYASSDTHALDQPEQQTITYTYFSDNLLETVTDALGRETQYSHDANGNLTSVTRLAGTPNAVTTSFGYEPHFNQLASMTDPLEHTTSFSYDQNGNMVTATDPLGHQAAMGYNNAGQVTSVTDALNNTVQLGYFGGDLVTVTDPLGNTSTSFTDAAGRVISSIDAQENTVQTQYSPLNLVTQVTDAQGNNTSFNYDGNGNLLTLTDALNHATSWTYDNMDRPATRTDPLNRQESYTYDLNGNLASGTDRKGQTTSVTYDALNRRTMVGYNTVVNGGNTTYESTITYTYDAGNRMTQAVDTAGGIISEIYDNLDRLTNETTAQGSISYGYDGSSRRTTMQVAGQWQLSYTYDNANRLTQIAQGSSSVGFSYDNINRRSSLTLPNGVNVSYSYDNDSRVTGISYQFGTNALGNLTYAYDSLGRRTQGGGSFANTGLPSAITSATYDVANELTNWNGTSISYDSNGNMLSDGSNSFTWNARNQVATLNNVSLQYDALGRRIKNAAGKSFLFDGANATQELSGTTVTANVWTGGLDEIFQRTDSNGTVAPITEALGGVLALADGSGNLTTQYSYDPFGNTIISGAASGNPSQYAGRENEGNGLYFLRSRYYSPVLGRFISEDPLAFAGSGPNSYAYVFDSPTNLVDPFGERGFGVIGGIDGGAGYGSTTGAVVGSVSVQMGVFGGTSPNLPDGPDMYIHTGEALTYGGLFHGDTGYSLIDGNYGYPPSNKFDGWAAGIWGGPGAGLFYTNAADAMELDGPFDNWVFATPVGNVVYAASGSIFQVSYTWGPIPGLGVAHYKTETLAGRNCPMFRTQPTQIMPDNSNPGDPEWPM